MRPTNPNSSVPGGSTAAAVARAFVPPPEEPVPILLVDDREENLVALDAVLRNPGYRLHKAQSGDDALRFLLDHLPALILMDVQMPGLDGYETAAIIKSNPRTREIPIIFITAINTDDRFLHRGYEHGAIDYIYKPFDSNVLRSKVAVLADLHRKTERLVRAEKALRETETLERERKIAELELRSLRREQIEQKRYRNLVESIGHGIVWAAEADPLSFSFVSGSAPQLTGRAAEDFLADPDLFLSMIPEEDRAEFLAAAQRAAHSATETNVEHRIRTAGGRTLWFHTGMRSSARPDGAGNELRGLSIDITTLKIAEHTLAREKRRSDILAHTGLLLSESLELAAPLRSLAAYLQTKCFDLCVVESFDGAVAAATGDETRDEAVRDAFRSHAGVFAPEARDSWAGGKAETWRDLSASEIALVTGHPARAEALAPLHLHSLVRVGLSTRGRPLGMLVLGLRAERALDDSDVSLAEDLAYRISAALENSSLYQKAEAAIRLRDEFLSIASHELRTPLTPLKIRVQQLQRQLDSPMEISREQVNKTVETCHRQIERLSKLIDDLLDISRISRGKLSLHPEPFDFSELVRDILSRFAAQLEAAGCSVETSLEGPLPVTLDLSRVEQVIVNLLTNAIKYAPGKPISIRAARAGNGVVLRVRDQGIGIAPADQDRIFHRFERAVSSSHFGGLGLGLYIVSQILAAHGGRIAVESVPGEGATFTVLLPASVADGAPRLETAG